MTHATFSRHEARWFWLVTALGALVAAVGLGAAHYMEEHGHIVTGMNNQIVWGLPHVFAIFMIVAASGVLNVASIGSVFGKRAYKVRAPLSGLLCVALLAGGLAVLMLDLGRPERMIVAATHYNFTSVFAWNVFLYTGMFAIVAVYLWLLMERRMGAYSGYAGLAAFVWRIVLTTGTGHDLRLSRRPPGVRHRASAAALHRDVVRVGPRDLSARAGGTLRLDRADAAGRHRAPHASAARPFRRRRSLLHARLPPHQRLLREAGRIREVHPSRRRRLPGPVLVGLRGGRQPRATGPGLPPAIHLDADRSSVASLLVIAGAFALLFVFIIGGQAWPLEIFPGHEVHSSFGDGQIAAYAPRLPEWLLGMGGVAIAFVITSVGVRVFPFMPEDDPVTMPAAEAAD